MLNCHISVIGPHWLRKSEPVLRKRFSFTSGTSVKSGERSVPERLRNSISKGEGSDVRERDAFLHEASG